MAAAVLAGVVLLAVAAVYLASLRLDGWARGALERRASSALAGTVRVGTFHVEPLALRARFTDLRVVIPAPGAPPLRAGAAAGEISLTWGGLLDLAGGRYRFREIVLEEPYLETSREFLQAWKRPERERRQVSWRIDRLVVRGGRLRHEDREIPLSVVASGLDLEGIWASSRDAVSGALTVVGSIARPPFARPYPLRVRTGFRLHGTALDLFQLRAEGEGLEAEGGVRVAFAERLHVTGSARAAADLARVRRFMNADVPALAGQVTGSLVLDASAGGFQLRGPVVGREVVVGPLRASFVQAQAFVHPGVLELSGLQAHGYGGRLRGGLAVEFAPHGVAFRTELTGEGLDSTALLRLAELPLPISSTVDAAISLRGDPGRPASWTGRGRLLARPRVSADGVATGATGEWTLEQGRLRVAGAVVQAAAADLRLDLDATLGVHPTRGTIVLEGRTRDAAETQSGTLRLLASLDVDPGELARRPLSGAGPVRVRIGLGGAADLDLSLALGGGAWHGHPFSSAALDLRLRGDDLTLQRAAAEGPAGRIEASATFGLRDGRMRGLTVATEGSDVSLLREVVSLPIDPGGRLTGDLSLATGDDGVLRGGGHLVLEDAALYGERLERGEAQVEVVGAIWTFAPMKLVGPPGEAEGSARVDTDAGTVEIALDRVEVALGGVEALRAAGVAALGTVSLTGTIHLGGEGATGELHVKDVLGSVAGIALARAEGRIDLFPDRVQVDLASPEERIWRLQGTLALDADHDLDAVLDVEEAVFDLPSAGSLATWALATGRVHVRGPLARLTALTAEGIVQRAEIHVGTALLETVAPVPLSLAEGRLRLEGIGLQGAGSSLTASLTLELERRLLHLQSEGTVDLGVLSAFVGDVRASGPAHVDLVLAGPLAAPRLTGRFSLQGGRLRVVGFPQAFEDIALTAVVDDTQATLSSFTARLGGGEIEASGSATLVGLAPSAYDLRAAGTRVRLTYPEGFTGIYSGELRLKGDADQARLSGDLHLLRGVYSQDFELVSLLGFGSREYAGTETELLPENVFLDVNLRSDGNVWVRNQLAEVEARLDLHVGGELTQPELTGRATLFEDGKLTFRDVEYRIRQGSLEFLDLERINPFLDVTAETHVEQYDITLHLEGTLEDFEYRLTSTPSLSEQDIIALLLTGRTLIELSESGGGTAASAFTGDVAANYFAGALTGRFTEQIQRAFGLEKLRIDPLLTQGQADPTARITVGKRVAEDVLLIYSTEIGAPERQFYQAEWQASRKFRVTGERDTTGGIGGGVQYSNRFFWQRRKPARPPVSIEEAGPAVVAIEIDGEVLGDEARLRRRLRLAVGESYRRSGLFEGMEQIRRWYVRRGRIQAEVDGTAEPVTGGVRLRYTVDPGPEVPLAIEGVSGRDRRRLRDRLVAYWVDTLYNEDLYRDSVDLARRYFQERGFYAADVQLVDQRQEGAGITLRIDRGRPVRVREVVIEGLSAVREERVHRQILTRADTLFTRSLLQAQVLEEDLVAVRNLLRDLGYLDVVVEPPRVVLAADGSEASITIRVHEGTAYKVGAVSFGAGLPFSEEELRAWTPFVTGDVFSPSRLLSAQTALRNKIDALGYSEARVRPQATRRDGAVDVRFDVVPGTRKTLRAVELVGNRRTRERVLRREIEMTEGQPISREQLLRAQHRLYRLGIFSSVRLETDPIAGSADPTAHLLRVHVEEAPPLDVTVGAGYDTEAGPRVTLALSDANVGGYDRRLGMQTRVSGKERRVQVLGAEPRLFSRDIDLLSTVQWEDVEQTGFSLERWSTAVRLEQKYKPHWTRYLRYNYQRNTVYDVEDPLKPLEQRLTGDSRLGDVGLSVVHDTRDDPFLPTRGIVASGELRVFATPLVSDASFVKLSLRASKVWTRPSEAQFASSLRVGTAWTFAGTEVVPLPERFFAGGDSTIRGFERDQAGPGTLVGNIPIGGEALLVANQEWRVPVWGRVKGVLFYDAGNAFLTPGDVRLSDIRHVLGTGVRVETPIGPLRLEYGHKLDRKEGESAGELFLAIGSAF